MAANGTILEVRGRRVGAAAQPLLCAPLIAKNRDALRAEAAGVAEKKPDLIEWRVDHFAAIGDTTAVLECGKMIRREVGDIPIMFTRRSNKEGGEPIGLDESAVVALYAAVSRNHFADLADFEMSNDAAHIREIRAVTRENGVKLILSYHNFQQTPDAAELDRRFHDAERLGADIAKVAVMPNNLEDVLALLAATLRAKATLRIPIMSMSMGGDGSLTRLFGWAFGSAITFAVGESGSAPGQIAIEDMRTAIGITRRAMSGY